ncbi:carbamoylphosphate synthase small subunit [Dysgonomonas sp. PFB1-18]|uniref:helix-turn-helix domain-containing protein n=1 Tax=unclassified Dysgonomonas TaxID=2630389 RepID=UPI0024733FF8|nr:MULTISPECIES: helix-turn-helix domain-containing protein [unclassified Dysgonomonas]MDH6310492.1 carbamoylphosphate synthase small subunit [Dysgonomonas sp. PF1-14]MDH6340930.1 carbamoylphosphate synthase small subunit [Dysgonomonas sp. PF1-16]MDH6382736.1 carbamoylphosphate synthase small subunit [Dysgonomonas sp. PFB1-18]MDH6399875.1 carbamoylphosphate synthase small subunit [Dysgonomonas sp. PF1-23]
MEIVNIEAQTFEAMLSKFENFAIRMEQLCCLHGDRDMKEWLDNQDVCQLLNISKRTLQTLRDNGTLAYSQISHKIHYKPEDVEKILPIVKEKQKQTKYKKNAYE